MTVDTKAEPAKTKLVSGQASPRTVSKPFAAPVNGRRKSSAPHIGKIADEASSPSLDVCFVSRDSYVSAGDIASEQTKARRASSERANSRIISKSMGASIRFRTNEYHAVSHDIGSPQTPRQRNAQHPRNQRAIAMVKQASNSAVSRGTAHHMKSGQIPSTSIERELETRIAASSCFQATKTKAASILDTTTMTVEDLSMENSDFNPNDPQLKAQLLNKLGLPNTATIEMLSDNGTFNDGVWFVSNALHCGLVLKLVPHDHQTRKTDREKYVELQQRCPRILSELSLTVPVKIFQLSGPDGVRCKDLLVMRQAPGLQITQHLYHKFHAGQVAELLNIFEEFGRFMRLIHQVYRIGNESMQHGDCQPSNVLYDEASGIFTLIDVADFGFGPYVAQGGENDVEHFVEGLSSLEVWYGRSLIDDCVARFRAGYDVIATAE
eukprot:CAMPEP_0169186248 /NCGR_PEP_ID=MMETSP1016-20121227/2253_1 /TAXON_ID=342587 /ORGANISM="Karlodinium micrum, Strain CCMP2283" /LENGTH=436 /DNA_ID=CAMNT_0009262055 /DNA_START=342 /DNA_END=1652 /DNA_ORIENTATION=+